MTDESDDVMPPWTSEELDLLRSAEADAPSARSLPAALAAVGVGTAIAAASAGAQAATASAMTATSSAGTGVAAAKSGASIALAKWIAVAAVGSAVVTGGVVLSRSVPANDHQAVPQLNRPVAHPSAQPPASRPTAVPAVQPAAVPAAEPPRAPVRAPRQPTASATAAHTPAQPDIRLEIAALDSARASLRNGHAREALAALDRYDSSFGPRSSLQLEASTLRIEALAQAGNRAKAETLARTFLAAHPNTPYAARIRALLTPAPTDR